MRIVLGLGVKLLERYARGHSGTRAGPNAGPVTPGSTELLARVGYRPAPDLNSIRSDPTDIPVPLQSQDLYGNPSSTLGQ